jgi:hypothetical protein
LTDIALCGRFGMDRFLVAEGNRMASALQMLASV